MVCGGNNQVRKESNHRLQLMRSELLLQGCFLVALASARPPFTENHRSVELEGEQEQNVKGMQRALVI